MESMFALESLYILDEPAEYMATYEELLEQASALESFADSLEDELFVYSAMEAASDDDIDTTASEISAKYRSGFEKIKKGKRSKNQKLVSEGQREVNEASDDLKEAEKNADTAEKKAKLRKVAKIAIAVGGAVLLALLAYVGIKNRSKIVGVIRKLKKNPGSNVAQTVSEVKNAASTAAATPVEEKPVAPVSDGEQSVHQQLSDVKQRVDKSISDRHEAAQKEIDAALKEIYSEPTPSKDSGRPSKKMVEIDKKLDELLIDSDTKPTPTASIKPREKTERQITADKIRADRAHKKELKDWKVVSDYDRTAEYSKDLKKVTSYRGTEDTDPEHIKSLKSIARMANRPSGYKLQGYSLNTLDAMFDKCREKNRSLPDGPEKEKYRKMKNAIYLQLKKSLDV